MAFWRFQAARHSGRCRGFVPDFVATILAGFHGLRPRL